MSDELVQTHSTGCHMFGPRHYECALREIERLTIDWVREQGERTSAEFALDQASLEIERLRAEVAARKSMLQQAESDLAALRKRVEEAPTCDIRFDDIGAIIDARPPRDWIGKRVALVVLD